MNAVNKKIATNTLALYSRMLIVMVVSLYSSRIVLEILGISDFGLFNLVGGIVVLVGILNQSMSSATQRFLNFEIGTENFQKVQRVFGTSILIHLILAAVIFVLAQTLGLWFINNHLNISENRLEAANWVYQFSVLSLIISIITVPYNAAIIANEKMSAFAYISIIEVILRLISIYCLYYFGEDKLILYSFLLLIVNVLVSLSYIIYSRYQFQECKTFIKRDKVIFKSMLSFSSWTILSNLSFSLRTQGINILLNTFFGTLINATQGIALQVSNAVGNFSGNFNQALNPQIVKSYAAQQLIDTRKYVQYGSRLSFYLVLFIILPLLIETGSILKFWLGNVPEFSVIFVRLILIQTLFESFSNILGTAQAATGKVKKYHLLLSSIGLMNLPLGYFFLKQNFPAFTPLIISIFLSLIITAVRLIFLKKSIQLSIREFVENVLFKGLFVGFISSVLPLCVSILLAGYTFKSIVVIILCLLSTLIISWKLGFNSNEREVVTKKIDIALKKIYNKVLSVCLK